MNKKVDNNLTTIGSYIYYICQRAWESPAIIIAAQIVDEFHSWEPPFISAVDLFTSFVGKELSCTGVCQLKLLK